MTSKKTAITVLVSIFIVGFASGLVTDNVFFAKSRYRRHHRGSIVSKFTKDLNLNESQQQKLKVLLKEIKTQYDQIRRETRPEYNKVRENFHNEFIKMLNDEQKQKYLVMEKKHEKRRKSNNTDFGKKRKQEKKTE